MNSLDELRAENHELRLLLETAIDADEANGIRKLIDGREYHCVKHDAAWIARVKDVLDGQSE